MNRTEFYRKLDEVIDVTPGTIRGEEKLADLKGWDSLAAVNFIAMVDEAFDITIAPHDLAGCKSVGDLCGLLGQRLESK